MYVCMYVCMYVYITSGQVGVLNDFAVVMDDSAGQGREGGRDPAQAVYIMLCQRGLHYVMLYNFAL